MKLKQYRVREFKSVWDSGSIEIDDRQTCLVGKNEAGKTALLIALYRTNPIIADAAAFDETYDYPKREIEDYRFGVRNGDRKEAVVVSCQYELEADDIELVAAVFGDKDSLFPLQGALGYEIQQTLFIGPNSLIVEGATDLLFLKAVSREIEREGRTGLSDKWIITPVGGCGRVPPFVALLGAQKGMNLATLLDIQNKDQPQIENLYKKKLLKKKNVHTYADFLDQDAADLPDQKDDAVFREQARDRWHARPPWAAGPPLVRRTGAAQSVRQLPRPDDAQAQAFRHEAVPTELRRTWQISDQTTRRCRRRILDGGDRG